MLHNHTKTLLDVRELKNTIVLENHKDEQSGIFNNRTFEKARAIIENQIVFSNMPFGYKDDNGKIVLVGYPSVFNHILALYFPEEMGVELKRTETHIYNDKSFTVKDLTASFNQIMLLKENAEKDGLPEESLIQLHEIINYYNEYKINFVIYNTKEQALIAYNLI